MRTAQEFRTEILKRKPATQGPSPYGSRVMSVLELYKGLNEYEERRAFQEALEILLQSNVDEERIFAVDVCLGFFVLRHAL